MDVPQSAKLRLDISVLLILLQNAPLNAGMELRLDPKNVTMGIQTKMTPVQKTVRILKKRQRSTEQSTRQTLSQQHFKLQQLL